MNQRNIDYLTERLFFLGFEEKLTAPLIDQIKQGKQKFRLALSIEFSRYNGEKAIVDYSVDFSKGKREEMYFINYYWATLKDHDASKQRSQLFFITKGNGCTVFEAFNLLEGRAVFLKLFGPNGAYYFQWQQLDFTRKDDNNSYVVKKWDERYGFNIERVLSEHGIKELNDPTQLKELIFKLHKGSRVLATLIVNEIEHPVLLEARPADRRVLAFDRHDNIVLRP